MGGGDGKQRKLGELWQGLAGGAGGRFLSERWPAQTPSSCSCGGRGTGAVGAGARRASEMGRTVAPPHQIDAGGDRDARNWGAGGVPHRTAGDAQTSRGCR